MAWPHMCCWLTLFICFALFWAFFMVKWKNIREHLSWMLGGIYGSVWFRWSTDNLQKFEIFEIKHKIGASFFWEHPVYTYIPTNNRTNIYIRYFIEMSKCFNLIIFALISVWQGTIWITISDLLPPKSNVSVQGVNTKIN